MSNDRVALYLQDAHPIREGMKLAQFAEKHGFEAVWQAESRLVRDAIVPMAAFAAITERIKVGSGVINNWTRNIGLLAATFLTLLYVPALYLIVRDIAYLFKPRLRISEKEM